MKVDWNKYIGFKIGDLEVLSIAYYDNYNRPHFECKCVCGNTFYPVATSVKTGKTTSCGHVRNEKNSINFSTHKKSKTRLYKLYYSIKARCNNPKNISYKNYGGRGIKICDEWLNDFSSFYNWSIQNGYLEQVDEKGFNKLSIDRIDVNGNYEPSNCRWITKKEQANNRSTNKFIFYHGMTKTISEWSEVFGFNYKYFHEKMKENNYSIEKVLEIPYFKEKLNDSENCWV